MTDSAINYLNDVMQQTVSHVTAESHYYGFTGSALPYCPTRDALQKCFESVGQAPARNTSFMEQIRMDMGNAVHTTLQNTMGVTGQLFGDWYCRKCKQTIGWTKVGPIFHCGRAAQYQEMKVRDEDSGFVGKVDGLIPYNNGYILVDFKTKETHVLKNIQTIDHHYRAQIFAYKYLLTKPPFNLPITLQAVIYVSRENPSLFKVMMLENDDLAEDEFKRYVKQKLQSEAALEHGNISALPKLCNVPGEEPYCPFNLYCFGPNHDILLDDVWRKSSYGKNKNNNQG